MQTAHLLRHRAQRKAAAAQRQTQIVTDFTEKKKKSSPKKSVKSVAKKTAPKKAAAKKVAAKKTAPKKRTK